MDNLMKPPALSVINVALRPNNNQYLSEFHVVERRPLNFLEKGVEQCLSQQNILLPDENIIHVHEIS